MLHCSSYSLLPLLGAAIVFLSCSLHCQAHSKNLMNKELCRTLNVGHELLVPVDDASVSVRLTNANGDAACYEDGLYNVTIRAHKSIYGLIIIQDPDKIYGRFPYINKREEIRLPSGLAKGFCENTPTVEQNLATFKNIPSVTHKCNYVYSHEYETKCNLGTNLNIPFEAHSNGGENIIEFRMSIVFSRHEFVEDRSIAFMPCSSPTTLAPMETTTAAPEVTTAITTKPYNPVCNVASLKVKDGTPKATTICRPNYPSNVTKEKHTITENNMNYTCDVEHRMKTCTTGCMNRHDKRLLCCRVKVNKIIQRSFDCTPDDPSASTIRRKFNVTSQKRCECFFCEDLCPAPPTETSSIENMENMEEEDSDRNSVELEHIMEGDDNEDNSVELKEGDEAGPTTLSGTSIE